MVSRSLSATLLVALVATAHAQYTTVNLSSALNVNIRTYTGGGNYTSGGTTLNVAGVPFALANLPGDGSSLGVVQSPPSTSVYDFTGLSIAGVGTLYTLINTANGGAGGVNEGMVEAFGTNGAHAVLNLTEGLNTRDHYQGQYENGLSDPTVVPTYFNGGTPSQVPGSGPDVLDRQMLLLGPSFVGQTVTELKFTAYGSGFPNGAAFLAAATFGPQAVPEPSALAALGLGAVAMLRRRSK